MNNLENNILQSLLKVPMTHRALLDLFPNADVDDFNFALESLELKGFVRYGIDGRYWAVPENLSVDYISLTLVMFKDEDGIVHADISQP